MAFGCSIYNYSDECYPLSPFICSLCGGLEEGRVRGIIFVKEEYLSLLCNNSSDPLLWLQLLCNNAAVAILPVRGSFDGGSENTVSGYGARQNQLTTISYSLTYNHSFNPENIPIYDSLKYRDDLHILFITKSYIWYGGGPVSIFPSTPITDSITDVIEHQTVVTWNTSSLPQALPKPSTLFDSCQEYNKLLECYECEPLPCMGTLLDIVCKRCVLPPPPPPPAPCCKENGNRPAFLISFTNNLVDTDSVVVLNTQGSPTAYSMLSTFEISITQNACCGVDARVYTISCVDTTITDTNNNIITTLPNGNGTYTLKFQTTVDLLELTDVNFTISGCCTDSVVETLTINPDFPCCVTTLGEVDDFTTNTGNYGLTITPVGTNGCDGYTIGTNWFAWCEPGFNIKYEVFDLSVNYDEWITTYNYNPIYATIIYDSGLLNPPYVTYPLSNTVTTTTLTTPTTPDRRFVKLQYWCIDRGTPTLLNTVYIKHDLIDYTPVGPCGVTFDCCPNDNFQVLFDEFMNNATMVLTDACVFEFRYRTINVEICNLSRITVNLYYNATTNDPNTAVVVPIIETPNVLVQIPVTNGFDFYFNDIRGDSGYYWVRLNYQCVSGAVDVFDSPYMVVQTPHLNNLHIPGDCSVCCTPADLVILNQHFIDNATFVLNYATCTQEFRYTMANTNLCSIGAIGAVVYYNTVNDPDTSTPITNLYLSPNFIYEGTPANIVDGLQFFSDENNCNPDFHKPGYYWYRLYYDCTDPIVLPIQGVYIPLITTGLNNYYDPALCPLPICCSCIDWTMPFNDFVTNAVYITDRDTCLNTFAYVLPTLDAVCPNIDHVLVEFYTSPVNDFNTATPYVVTDPFADITKTSPYQSYKLITEEKHLLEGYVWAVLSLFCVGDELLVTTPPVQLVVNDPDYPLDIHYWNGTNCCVNNPPCLTTYVPYDNPSDLIGASTRWYNLTTAGFVGCYDSINAQFVFRWYLPETTCCCLDLVDFKVVNDNNGEVITFNNVSLTLGAATLQYLIPNASIVGDPNGLVTVTATLLADCDGNGLKEVIDNMVFVFTPQNLIDNNVCP